MSGSLPCFSHISASHNLGPLRITLLIFLCRSINTLMPSNLMTLILDWAGTVVDFGSRAPIDVFTAAFAAAGVEVSAEQAKPFMGLPKRDHIRAIGALPDVARRWEETHGRPMTDADVDTLHARLLPLSLETAAGHASLIPGARNTLAELHRRGIVVGSTTGYIR